MRLAVCHLPSDGGRAMATDEPIAVVSEPVKMDLRRRDLVRKPRDLGRAFGG